MCISLYIYIYKPRARGPVRGPETGSPAGGLTCGRRFLAPCFLLVPRRPLPRPQDMGFGIILGAFFVALGVPNVGFVGHECRLVFGNPFPLFSNVKPWWSLRVQCVTLCASLTAVLRTISLNHRFLQWFRKLVEVGVVSIWDEAS